MTKFIVEKTQHFMVVGYFEENAQQITILTQEDHLNVWKKNRCKDS